MPESKERKAAAEKRRRGRLTERTDKPETPGKKKAKTDEVEPKEKPRLHAPGSRQWVAPAFITIGLLGVIWLVVFYIAGRDVPFMNKLGNWNILVGMGLMAVSLGLSMLWK